MLPGDPSIFTHLQQLTAGTGVRAVRHHGETVGSGGFDGG